jgi:endo-1,4-beta-xylanase
MKRNIYIFSLLFLTATVMGVTIPEGGTLVMPVDLQKTVKWYYNKKVVDKSVVKVEGESFDKAFQYNIKSDLDAPWGAQTLWDTTGAVEKGDVLWIRFFARSLKNENESGEGLIRVIFQRGGGSYYKSLSHDVNLSPVWKEFYTSFKVGESYAPGKANVGFQMGLQKQLVEVADIQLFSYGKTKKRFELPSIKNSYEGQASDAPWRGEAALRIENIRKASLALIIVDSEGNPVKDVQVHIKLKRHSFGFGSAVDAGALMQEGPDGDAYRRVVEKNFSRVVFENDLKWDNWDNVENRQMMFKATEWLHARDIEIRGHCLVWPNWRHVPRNIKDLKDDPEALRKAVDAHVIEEVSAMRGKVIHWDVINEPYTNHEIMDVLGNEEMIRWFKLARKNDSDVKLFLNDYSILSGAGRDTKHQDHFEKTLRFLKEGGAPIHGLGMQSHFGSTLTPPEKVFSILDRFAALGLIISLTEHDINMDDEVLQADYTRDFMTIAFSHPAVEGFLSWGFWEGRHWKPEAAYFRKDWELKPAGKVWLDLFSKEWSTDLKVKSDKRGQVNLL